MKKKGPTQKPEDTSETDLADQKYSLFHREGLSFSTIYSDPNAVTFAISDDAKINLYRTNSMLTTTKSGTRVLIKEDATKITVEVIDTVPEKWKLWFKTFKCNKYEIFGV